MAQEKRFCTSCGAPIGIGDKFCGSCGHPASGLSGAPTPAPAATSPSPLPDITAPPTVTPATPPTTAPSATGEQLIGIIPAVYRKKSLLKNESFNILVTEKRMVFAEMTQDMIKEEVKKAGKEGFFAGMLSSLTAGYDFYKRYLNMPPEEALKETPQNFFIDLNRIKKVKIKEGRNLTRGSGVPQYEDSQLEIETTGDKYKFTLPHRFVSAARDVVHKAGIL